MGGVASVEAMRVALDQQPNIGTPPLLQGVSRVAFTLVELLVVIAIIGVLIALLLPAVQSARERSRISTCTNHLRQLAIASANLHNTHRHLPSGGWGSTWTGDPNQGFGELQPGGWTFSLLPYVEQGSTLHAIGRGKSGQDLRESLTIASQVPLPLFHCPSRRATQLYPNAWPYDSNNSNESAMVARSDYAACAGDRGNNKADLEPTSLESGLRNFDWPSNRGYTGVVFQRSTVSYRQITDGTSHTLLVGEKYLCTTYYTNGRASSDRGHLLIGFAPDTIRITRSTLVPQQDGEGVSPQRFGSAHASMVYFAFCDGSVRGMTHDVDATVFKAAGNRSDGN